MKNSRQSKLLELFKTGNYSVEQVSKKLGIPKYTIYSDIKTLISFNKVEEKEEIKAGKTFVQYYGIATDGGIPETVSEYLKWRKKCKVNYNSFANLCYRGVN
jgi:predicted ArsR family transcriptional regulator